MEEEEKVSDSLRMAILHAQLGQSPLARHPRQHSWGDGMRCECRLRDEQ